MSGTRTGSGATTADRGVAGQQGRGRGTGTVQGQKVKLSQCIQELRAATAL